ncbi:class II fructose-bisphosphate aldolase [Eubacteriaceae bacterium ES2]|nr:class II fructose-bisphosphate aldolase [Eubacteriaceae bacterium ES2]
MLTDLKTVLKDKKRAVAAFNVYNSETVLAVYRVAVEEERPVIFSFGESYMGLMPIGMIAKMVRYLAETTPIPMALHLDHARSMESIQQAVNGGFTSVMFDGSNFSLDENIRRTKAVVDLVSPCGVSVEGELGYLNPEDGSNGRTKATNPDHARQFVVETGVDALAIAIGNAHGLYRGVPKLDFLTLEKINENVAVPLVLHGASGIPDDQLKKAINLGVQKINFNTEIALGVVRAMAKQLQTSSDSLRYEKVIENAVQNMQEIMRQIVEKIS